MTVCSVRDCQKEAIDRVEVEAVLTDDGVLSSIALDVCSDHGDVFEDDWVAYHLTGPQEIES